jgi:hypothetical protein
MKCCGHTGDVQLKIIKMMMVMRCKRKGRDNDKVFSCGKKKNDWTGKCTVCLQSTESICDAVSFLLPFKSNVFNMLCQ